MNLATKLIYCFVVLEIQVFCFRDAAFTNCMNGRAMATRRLDPFLFSSPHEEQLTPNENSKPIETSQKRIVFIRHGQTYMNELIGGGGITFGQPNFTDIFDDPEDQEKFHDSPLSDVGIQQARSLNSKLWDLKEKNLGAFEALGTPSQSCNSPRNEDNCTDSIHTNFLDDLDLVVVSPLTRALQTLELSLYEHIANDNERCPAVPILAVAAAAERLYLVSDIGKPRSELRSKYPFVDFDSAFSIDCDSGKGGPDDVSGTAPNEEEDLDVWYFSPSKQLQDEYSEWRPHGQGQMYACLGEPPEYFDRRMSNLYYWLEKREEKCIAIVCHAGVIEWMTGERFSNCELRVQTFGSLRPRALQDKYHSD